MNEPIDRVRLRSIARHHRSLSLRFRMTGLPYERCAELPWIVGHLEKRFAEPLSYLDIGSGESPLPSYVFQHSRWDVTCLDKCHWVRSQRRFARPDRKDRRFRVVLGDLLEAPFPDESFDIITSVSVIEHFEGETDSAAMRATGRLLRPGGQCILTTLVNEPFFREFYVARSVYGAEFRGEPVFYQRHYDLRNLQQRLIRPSGLLEVQRTYFGDYGFQCFETVLQRPKALRLWYRWAAPWLAARYLSYSPQPLSRNAMRMNTASGVILLLEKPRSADRKA